MKSVHMPTSITIRDIPDEVHKRLKERAERHHRSLNSEIIVSLKRSVMSHERDPDQILARADQLRKRVKGSLTMEEIQAAIEEGRP